MRGRFCMTVLPVLVTTSTCVHAKTTVSYFSEAIIITTDERHAGPVDTPADVGRAIEACWRAPHVGDEITVRLSFRRDGSVFGKPFITFRKASADSPDANAKLSTSIAEGIARCAPLPFTDRFGAEIAGQVFLIRFIAS